MGLSNYTYCWTLKSSKPLEEINEFKLFEDIVTLSDKDECFFHVSKEIGHLLHSENQFNKVFEAEYGRIKYSDFLRGDKLAKLGTLKDAKPWFDSAELTVIEKTEDDWDILENKKLLFFFIELRKYLDEFKWHSEKPQIYAKLDEVNLVILITKFCIINKIKIKMIST